MIKSRRGFIILCSITAILIVFAGRLHNYSLTYFKWISEPSAIYGFSNTLDCPEELTAIQNAATTWNGSGAAFTFPQIQEGPSGGFRGIFLEDGQNQIGWLDTWPGKYNGFIAITVALENKNTGEILQVDTAFDDGRVWSTESIPHPGTYDVQSVMLHEFGHWLKLWHSTNMVQEEKAIVMQPSIPSGPSGIRRVT